MDLLQYILIAVGVVIIAYVVTIYNNLVSLKNSVQKNWANIDVLLKQRNSELPKLITTCKEYMRYEQDTLEKIVEARSQAMQAQNEHNMTTLGAAEILLRQGLGKLFALAENYPDLKTNTNFSQLQARISGLEDAIVDRREFYNESVNLNNIRIEQFPDIVVAKLFGFKHFTLLKFSADEIKDINIQDLFRS